MFILGFLQILHRPVVFNLLAFFTARLISFREVFTELSLNQWSLFFGLLDVGIDFEACRIAFVTVSFRESTSSIFSIIAFLRCLANLHQSTFLIIQ